MVAIILSKTQRELVKKIVIYIVCLIFTSSIPIYLNGHITERDKKHVYIKNDIDDLTRKLEGFNKKTLEFADAVKIWENLSEDDQKLQGLRINDAKDTLDKLQAKYKLSSLKTSFSKPVEIEGDFKTESVTMVSSTISTTFNAISDEYIYNFINDIIHNFPGLVQVKSLSISKPAAISKEILKKISMGEEVSIFAVTLDFYWHDLKSKSASTPPLPEGGAKTP